MPVARGVAIPPAEVGAPAGRAARGRWGGGGGRSSGPGGQHANVTASRIEAVFDVAASRALDEEQKRRVMARCGPRVVAVAQDARSQARNRELALERLAARLSSALHVPRRRRATRPTRASRERRRGAEAGPGPNHTG